MAISVPVISPARRSFTAGLELRLQLVERDDHDEVLAEWERSFNEETRTGSGTGATGSRATSPDRG